MTDFAALFARLSGHNVEFIVIGGFAATAHGSAFLTVDLDIVYHRTPENLARLAESLADLQPYLRGAPRGLPFVLDAAALKRGLNFMLTTTAGDIDLLGEASGGGTYEALLPRSEVREVFGFDIRFVNLDALIHLKRSAGRAKDLERIAELEALREERDRA